MAKTWKFLDWSECPTCGSDLEVFTDHDECIHQLVFDGDEVRCFGYDKCEVNIMHISVDEYGNAWINGDW